LSFLLYRTVAQEGVRVIRPSKVGFCGRKARPSSCEYSMDTSVDFGGSRGIHAPEKCFGGSGLQARDSVAGNERSKGPTLRQRREGARGNGWIYVTIEQMVEIREYLGRDGRNLFSDWFARLNSEAARRVTTALYRVGLGSFSNVKGVGGGVFECRIDFGPGYRVYFGKMASGS